MQYPFLIARHFSFVAWLASAVLVHSNIVAAQKDTHLTPASVETILVPVSVINEKQQNHILGLTKDDFTVLVNGKPQDIVFFNNQEEPSSICIIYDVSGSVIAWNETESKLITAANQIPSRLAAKGHGSNEYFLFAFNDQTKVLLDGVSKDKVLEEMSKPPKITPTGNTATYDALSFAINKVSNARHKNRAIVLIADWQPDQTSLTKLRHLNEQIGASGIPIYILNMAYTYREDYTATVTISNIVNLSGGEAFNSTDFFYYRDKNFEVLEQGISFLLNDIQFRYTLGFKAPSSKDRWNRVKVKVNLPPDRSKERKHITVRSREKYYADTNSP